jgi:protein-S-isoprenylcysteine O-methyltransferase Ste14
MNLLNPWNAVFFAGFIVYFGIRHIYIQRTKTEPKVVRHLDRTEKLLLAAMVPPILLLPNLYLFTPWLSFADYQIPVGLKCVGVVSLVASLWLFWRSHADLGQNWSVSLEIRENHQLVTHGVYQKVRHPMYSSIWLWGIAQGLLLENWLAGWLVIPAFAAMYFLRTPREERMMRETFGEDYEQYMRQTGRLFPRFRKPAG